jgi:lantibiotic modifying enzyme
MMVVFTNIYPPSSDSNYAAYALESLIALIGNETIAVLIHSCLDLEPDTRPGLDAVSVKIREIRAEVAKGLPTPASVTNWALDAEKLYDTISGGINGLASSIMLDKWKIWHSNSLDNDGNIANRQKGLQRYTGIYAGISGPIYTVARVKRAGFSIRQVQQAYLANGKKLLETAAVTGAATASGLYHGSAGMAVAIAAGMEAGLLTESVTNKKLIARCLSSHATGLTIERGAAGQGLAILNCLPFLVKEEWKKNLDNLIGYILDKQRGDGSWVCDGVQATGFSNGVAGIAIFLIEYLRRYYTPKVESSVIKALTWLENKSGKRYGKPIWLISNKEKVTNPWLGVGFTGVALCFTRAYSIFNSKRYKEIATRAFQNHPIELIANDLSVLDGITGIGDTYVEAFRTFRDEEWIARARAIAWVIGRTYCQHSSGSYYWHVDTKKNPTADFMMGTSGIVDFLMAFQAPDKTAFPLLPELNNQKLTIQNCEYEKEDQ